jgi:hypothetical protein
MSQKEAIKFTIENTQENNRRENHVLSVDKVTSSSIEITISSNTIKAILNIREEKKFDLTNDSYYDLYVKLNSISNNKANFTIKSIYEAIWKNVEIPKQIPEIEKPKEEVPVELPREIPKKSLLNEILIISLIAVIGIIVFVLFLKKKHRRKQIKILYTNHRFPF